jgi:hypothetical protein
MSIVGVLKLTSCCVMAIITALFLVTQLDTLYWMSSYGAKPHHVTYFNDLAIDYMSFTPLKRKLIGGVLKLWNGYSYFLIPLYTVIYCLARLHYC